MFDEFQRQAAKTFKPHEPISAEQAELLDWALGVGGEAGEVEEVIKHHVFSHEELDKMKLAKELGDVLWYISAIASSTGIEMSSIAELNQAKLSHRYKEQKYSDEDSALRHETEQKFEDTLMYQSLKSRILHTPAPLNVIFVGPDGSGKTTISQAVAQRLAPEGFTYHKCNYEQEDKVELGRKLIASKTNVIYDRFYYPDDIIYSRVRHERESAEPMDWGTPYWKSFNILLRELCELNTLFILTVASEEVLTQRASVWKDDYVRTDELHKICELYDRWRGAMCAYPLIIVDLDTTDRSVDDCVDICVENIRRAQAVFANMDENSFINKEENKNGEDDTQV